MGHNLQAGQVLNVFSPEEIKLMLNAFQKIPNLVNEGGGKFHAYTNGFQKHDLIYPFFKKIVLPKIEKYFNKEIQLTQGLLLKAQVPWKIHTDYPKTDSHPDLAILIPLNSEPIDSHTLIFNELCLNKYETYIEENSKLEVNCKNLVDTYMSHETVNRLEYISLSGIYRWEPGSLIYWDRKLLHSSDNFLANNISEKVALLLFTNNDG